MVASKTDKEGNNPENKVEEKKHGKLISILELLKRENYKPENSEKEFLKAEHKASESTAKPENREEEIAAIKRLIGRNEDNLSLLGDYAEFTGHKRVEEMTSEERKKAIEFLGGKGNGK